MSTGWALILLLLISQPQRWRSFLMSVQSVADITDITPCSQLVVFLLIGQSRRLYSTDVTSHVGSDTSGSVCNNTCSRWMNTHAYTLMHTYRRWSMNWPSEISYLLDHHFLQTHTLQWGQSNWGYCINLLFLHSTCKSIYVSQATIMPVSR